ncbi:hypothetical protein J2799_001973 [Chryseobacterium vietnamense]|uniref:hypothetical protein n=1 Tax=Chryseobacterium vietnamense TaxID=866785 RepID=UPI0028557204|nr:hypothetical protein [Chryseobacterium vietnamense]MDR6487468.1 hypothetical protein [Chryseobacterium vietnamense]
MQLNVYIADIYTIGGSSGIVLYIITSSSPSSIFPAKYYILFPELSILLATAFVELCTIIKT